MDAGAVSGMIGGAVTFAVLAIWSAKVRDQSSNGCLQWGWGLLLLGLCCLAFAGFAFAAFFYDADIWTDRGEFLAVIALVVGFGAATVLCFVDDFVVRGKYDDQGIEFRTPWTGTKVEKWSDLQSVEYSPHMGWYVLTFRSGKVIRLSMLLSGHGDVIETLDNMGFQVE